MILACDFMEIENANSLSLSETYTNSVVKNNPKSPKFDLQLKNPEE